MIVLDTSFIVSYYNIRDENHEKSVELMREVVNRKYGNLYITDYIFDESITVMFIRLKSLSETIRIGELIKKSMEIIEVGKEIFEESWKSFKKQKETAFSFTDCVTLNSMKKMKINNIATFDEDFKKIKTINIIGL
jgi:predicted nucleic acid-binding protein